jgi:glycosyltransferase involved in cell wall biosynthesis
MGTPAFGKERRAVSALTHMGRVTPYFLISKWEDGSVSRLLKRHDFEFAATSFGYLGRARLTWTLVTLLQMPRLFATVINSYVKRRCHVILILSILSFVNALPPILALKYFARARLVFYLGDIPGNYAVNRILARLINRMADRVIANSDAVKQGLMRVGIEERKIGVIYNGKDLTQFENATPIEFRKRYGWPSGSILIGYAGQFNFNKGIWDFIKAAELVLQRDPNCRFLMIGKVEKGDGLPQLIAQYLEARGLHRHIVFAGWLDEMEAAYAALDIMIVPSRHEDPAPNVNIEAMASGIPVITTRVGGAPEIVLDGVTGFLVDRASPQQIGECLLRLAKDQALRERMGCAGRERVRMMFDACKNARLVEEALLDG